MNTQSTLLDTADKHIRVSQNLTPLQKFIAWMDKMDYNRLIILVGTILFQGCVTAPFAMWSMDAVVGYDTVQMSVITIGSFAVLVTNLSVQPMRITIPTFIISTCAQMVVIALNISHLF